MSDPTIVTRDGKVYHRGHPIGRVVKAANNRSYHYYAGGKLITYKHTFVGMLKFLGIKPARRSNLK